MIASSALPTERSLHLFWRDWEEAHHNRSKSQRCPAVRVCPKQPAGGPSPCSTCSQLRPAAPAGSSVAQIGPRKHPLLSIFAVIGYPFSSHGRRHSPPSRGKLMPTRIIITFFHSPLHRNTQSYAPGHEPKTTNEVSASSMSA
jgi:hypothetical protein